MVSANSLSGSIPATIDDLENLTSPGCELTYPLYDIPANRFEVPISIKVKAKCVVEDPTDPLRADPHRHLTCQMCMNHRCGSDDPHSCGAKMGYEDPSGYQKNKCMCGCCHLQCAISKWCESHLESEEDPLVDPQPRLPRGRLHHSDARSRAWLAPVLKAAGATAIVSGMVIAAYMGVSRRTPSVPQV
mmetsp:Transcript_14233/g.43171  ORF Transcript_14233/g.43171 Transcript_14233/m.43171 type:complete len:188 (-) Transcript_14233:198-761(-)